jgi:hypothetical protein
MKILHKLQDYKYLIHSTIGLYPSIYYKIYARKYPFNQMAVTHKTEICIEGFPRSANSYAVVAFKLNNKDIKVGHHLHIAAQVVRAADFGIPNVVVIRKPEDAVASFLVFQSSFNARAYLKSYIRFHRTIMPFLNKTLFASFETVTLDFNKIIISINDRFGKCYNLVQDLEKSQKLIFTRLEEINNQFFAGQFQKNMAPDEQRKKLNARARESVLKSPYLEEANNIYQKLKDISV